jgi:hypothetical protein
MSEVKKFPWIVPLYNFDSDAGLVTLHKSLRLRRVESDELENLMAKLTRHVEPYLLLLEAKYVLEDRIGHHSMKDVHDMIVALRMLKAGDFKILVAFHLHERDRMSLGIYDDIHKVSFSSNPYFLEKREIADSIELWKKMQDRTSKQYLDFPLGKFMEAYDREGFDDKIVDYMVAFESLVFHHVEGGDTQRICTPMAIAISMLLGNSKDERDTIRKNMQDAYDVRSAKVHGYVKKPKGRKEDIRQLSMQVEDYLRRALRRFVEE